MTNQNGKKTDRMQVGLFFNEKGGVGKTTMCSNAAAGLAMRGYRVLVLDADGQANLTSALDLPKQPFFYDFCRRDPGDGPGKVPNSALVKRVAPGVCPGQLYAVPGNEETWGITSSSKVFDIVRRVGQRFRSLAKVFDYILIDSQPSASPLHDAMTLLSTWVLIPTDPEPFGSEDAVPSAIAHIEYVQEQLRGRGRDGAHILGIVPNKFRVQTTLHSYMHDKLTEEYGEMVWPPLRLRTAIPEAQVARTFLMSLRPDDESAEILNQFINRIEYETQGMVTNVEQR